MLSGVCIYLNLAQLANHLIIFTLKNVYIIFLKKVVRSHQHGQIFWAMDTNNTLTSVHFIFKKKSSKEQVKTSLSSMSCHERICNYNDDRLTPIDIAGD